jgi:hypothetical protein
MLGIMEHLAQHMVFEPDENFYGLRTILFELH